MIARALLALFALATLAGCASPAAPPPPPDATPSPAAAAPAPGGTAGFDGLYKPTSSTGMAKEAHNRCNNTMSNLHVHNGDAAMTWRGTMHGKVAPDGSLDMQTNESHLSGQIAGGVFTGKLETPVCVYSVTLTRS